MLIWGGRLLTTDDDQIAGVWSLDVNVKRHPDRIKGRWDDDCDDDYLQFVDDDSNTRYSDRTNEGDDEEALIEFYLLVTTILFISMMFIYMYGTCFTNLLTKWVCGLGARYESLENRVL